MTHEHAPDLLILRLRHAVAEAQLVLFDLLLWCADVLDAWWRAADWRDEMLVGLRHLRQAQAMLVFLAAQSAMRSTTGSGSRAAGGRGPRRPCRPPNAPRGYSRALYTHRRRSVWRFVPSGRGLRGRIEALRAARDRFDALVVRMAARLREGARTAAYIMTQAPDECCAPLAEPDACAVDSS